MSEARRAVRRMHLCAGLILIGLMTAAFMSARITKPVPAQEPQQPQQPVITPNIPIIPAGQAYRQTNLVSDIPGLAAIQDPLLVNPWGIASSATSPFWIANNGTSTATLYGGDVRGSPLAKNALTVTIPGGLPTGSVFNGSSDFVITAGGGTGPARFIFASQTGNIDAWRAGTSAIISASQPGHVYMGLAIGSIPAANRLYAADFANNHIDVFDGTFTPTTVTGGFVDPTVPATFHAFNIQNLGGSVYVAYAQ